MSTYTRICRLQEKGDGNNKEGMKKERKEGTLATSSWKEEEKVNWKELQYRQKQQLP